MATATTITDYRLHGSLGYRLSLAARIQERRLDDGLRKLGLTRTTWCILLALGNEGLLQPSDIAAFVGIDRTATSRSLRQMEAVGLIARRAGSDDRRTTEVELTAKGADLLRQGTPLAIENNARMEANLSDREAAELHRLLDKIHAGEIVPLDRL